MYTKQQKEDIENILKMFNDYVQNHMTVDVLWSDKAGYLFGYLDSLVGERRTYEYEPVLSAEDLLDKFHEEFYENVMVTSEEFLLARYGNLTDVIAAAENLATAQVQKILEEHNSPIKYEPSDDEDEEDDE